MRTWTHIITDVTRAHSDSTKYMHVNTHTHTLHTGLLHNRPTPINYGEGVIRVRHLLRKNKTMRGDYATPLTQFGRFDMTVRFKAVAKGA